MQSTAVNSRKRDWGIQSIPKGLNTGTGAFQKIKEQSVQCAETKYLNNWVIQILPENLTQLDNLDYQTNE